MKLSTKRVTKIYQTDDEVKVGITEIKENQNGNISMKLNIYDGEQMTATFFYQTIGDPLGKGRYYLEQFFNAVGVPEDLEVDLNYFKGKTFRCVLGENVWQGKTNLTVGTYINAEGKEEENMLPNLPDLTEDIDLTSKPKGKRKKSVKEMESLPDHREDFTSLLDE